MEPWYKLSLYDIFKEISTSINRTIDLFFYGGG